MLLPLVLFASIALVQQTPPTLPVATTSQAEVTTPPPATATRPVSDTAQICRTEPVTGSRFGRRVCRSAAQTEEDRAASRELLRQMQGARVPPVG